MRLCVYAPEITLNLTLFFLFRPINIVLDDQKSVINSLSLLLPGWAASASACVSFRQHQLHPGPDAPLVGVVTSFSSLLGYRTADSGCNGCVKKN